MKTVWSPSSPDQLKFYRTWRIVVKQIGETYAGHHNMKIMVTKHKTIGDLVIFIRVQKM